MKADDLPMIQAAALSEMAGRLRRAREVVLRTDWQTEEARQMGREILAAIEGEVPK